MKIYKVAGFLDSRGFQKRIYDIEVTEKGKSFIGEG